MNGVDDFYRYINMVIMMPFKRRINTSYWRFCPWKSIEKTCPTLFSLEFSFNGTHSLDYCCYENKIPLVQPNENFTLNLKVFQWLFMDKIPSSVTNRLNVLCILFHRSADKTTIFHKKQYCTKQECRTLFHCPQFDLSSHHIVINKRNMANGQNKGLLVLRQHATIQGIDLYYFEWGHII